MALGVGQGTVDSAGTEETDYDRTVLGLAHAGLVFARAGQGFGGTGLSFPIVPIGMEYKGSGFGLRPHFFRLAKEDFCRV